MFELDNILLLHKSPSSILNMIKINSNKLHQKIKYLIIKLILIIFRVELDDLCKSKLLSILSILYNYDIFNGFVF